MLSEDFKRNYGGMISGNGRISCFFDYKYTMCDSSYDGPASLPRNLELPIYMNQLILRTTVGSEFKAKLVIVRKNTGAYRADRDDEIWYEFNARVTRVAMEFIPAEPVESTIEFVATGPIRLRTQYDTDLLTQENADGIELESNQDVGNLRIEDSDDT